MSELSVAPRAGLKVFDSPRAALDVDGRTVLSRAATALYASTTLTIAGTRLSDVGGALRGQQK